MRKEDKELLLKDLSARLPYGVIVHHKNVNRDFNLIAVFNDGRIGVSTLKENIGLSPTSINECQPYLRPMSSMTEEEKGELQNNFCYGWNYKEEDVWDFFNHHKIYTADAELLVGWLNSHHFDYRGLIENGLAIEASEGMYCLA